MRLPCNPNRQTTTTTLTARTFASEKSNSWKAFASGPLRIAHASSHKRLATLIDIKSRETVGPRKAQLELFAVPAFQCFDAIGATECTFREFKAWTS